LTKPPLITGPNENEDIFRAPTVYIVDDDLSVRESLGNLMRSVGLNVILFASALEFRRHKRAAGPACLVLDVRLPGMSGLDLQSELLSIKDPIPVVFITGHGDIPMSVRAMKAGAFEFLPKPFREQDLLDAIHGSLARFAEPGPMASSVTERLAGSEPIPARHVEQERTAMLPEPLGDIARLRAPAYSPRDALSRNLQLGRTIFKWTQEELGNRCNLHRSHISALERADLSVGVDAIDGIAVAFDVLPHVMLLPPGEAQLKLLEAHSRHLEGKEQQAQG